MKKVIIYLCLWMLMIQNGFAQASKFIDKSVRFVYLVSKDRSLNPEYKKAIEMAAIDIQAWYKKQLNGNTFKLNNSVVEIAYSDKKATYFYANPNGENKDVWGFHNTLSEANRLLGARQLDPNYIWVIYSDGPGNSGRGGGGVCIMPEDDLLGLIGKHPSQPDIKRWIAGLGHELGHAFGLPHPSDTQKDADAIMWTGIYGGKYPDKCYLTAEDKEKLNQSPFFFEKNGKAIKSQQLLLSFSYANGDFFKRIKNLNTQEISWKEYKRNMDVPYSFSEKGQDSKYYYLKDTYRDIEIKIPLEGGQSYWSANSGKDWLIFQMMTKLKESDSASIPIDIKIQPQE